MKDMRNVRNSLALAGSLATMTALLSSQAFAAPQHPGDPRGGLVAPATIKPYVAENGLGQALIVPYYTMRDGQRTAINIMNTSNETLAVKAVFREGKHSRDVLNFYILLSPYDVWSGYLSNSTGKPLLHRSKDEDSCVVGAFGRVKNNVFTAMATETEQLKTKGLKKGGTADDLLEGYITFIAAGKIIDGALKGNVKHSNISGVPANCQAAAEAFTVTKGTPADMKPAVLNAFPLKGKFNGLTPYENPLKGNFTIMDSDDGIAGGSQATAIANFNQTVGYTPLVTPQVFPYYNEPTLASGKGLCTIAGLDDVEDAMRANSIINEWAYVPARSVETDWVITFPTKGFRTDVMDGDSNSLKFCRGIAGDPKAASYPVYYNLYAFDREEREPILAPEPSPEVFGQPNFPYEVNVISFQPTLAGPLASKLRTNYDLASDISGTPAGWAEIKLTASGDAKGTSANMKTKVKDVPALGFVYKVRKQPGSANTNFGQIIDHSTVAVSP